MIQEMFRKLWFNHPNTIEVAPRNCVLDNELMTFTEETLKITGESNWGLLSAWRVSIPDHRTVVRLLVRSKSIRPFMTEVKTSMVTDALQLITLKKSQNNQKESKIF